MTAPLDDLDNAIAIVGMAARVPGAATADEFWRNIRDGVESITSLSEEQLRAAGVRREVARRPGYVRSAAMLDRMEWFDAEFFGFSPKDAAIMDPQHRHFLEVCWEALDDAAHPPSKFPGAVGVFGGCGMGAYFAFNLLTNPELVDDIGMFLLRHTGNDKDFLVTRASYLLDLQGPAVNVQTACSTSLVATHLAVQHLLSGECDMALAGGVTIEIPHGRGYQYEPGEILSPDGHCRAFDDRAAGTVFGSGAGVVVLRRFADAVADGDHIYALIRGTAVNNDGARKVGYLAPSVEGQAACVAEALAVAGVESTTVQLVECHGTGTAMGDPIEVAALTEAFTAPVDGQPYCAIGSVKTNIGHLDTAAGVISLMKASLSLHHRAIPPSLHFERPNRNIAFDGTPFSVARQLEDWPAVPGSPRRAGVNSLGVGGTNAFAVLEEAPPQAAGTATVGPQLLALSARNTAALDDAARRLATHLREHPGESLADVAFTLHHGRHDFGVRRVLAASSTDEAVQLLEGGDPRRVFSHNAADVAPAVVFLLPGGGAQYPGMAAGLYEHEPVFRRFIDDGIDLAERIHGLDLRPLLLPPPGQTAEQASAAAAAFEHASSQLPALFIVEHALAQLLISRGVQPSALLGHSVGENVAACVGGSMRFADCLGLVALRGRLMDRTLGGMLSVPLPPADVQPLLDDLGLDLAVINAPDLCVASGPDELLVQLHDRLAERGVECHRVRINIAAHSRLLDPVVAEFRAYLTSIPLAAPHTRWVSNTTGEFVTDQQATDPDYWAGQLRSPVQFSAGVATVAAAYPKAVFVEVGPGRTLSTLARLNPAVTGAHHTVHTMRHPDDATDDLTVLLTALGRVWASGGRYPVESAYTPGRRRRISLPAYAFQQQRYFIEPGAARAADVDDDAQFLDRVPADDWYWQPVWQPNAVVERVREPQTFVVLADQLGIADDVSEQLRAVGHRVAVVRMGDRYRMHSPEEYVLPVEQGKLAYEQLVADLVRSGLTPDRLLNLAPLTDHETFRPGSSFFHRNQELGFYALMYFVQAWAAEGLRKPLHVLTATANAQRVLPDDQVLWPEQSTVLGPVLVMPHELPAVTAVAVDLALPVQRTRRGQHATTDHADAVAALTAEATAASGNAIAAWRGATRLVRTFAHAAPAPAAPFPLRKHGVVLITGGVGGIGLTLARSLHERVEARVVLVSRTPLPPDDAWASIANHASHDDPLGIRLRSLLDLRAAGADVAVVTADVTNVDSMRTVIRDIRRTHGGLHGIVHAAGVNDDGPLLDKDSTDVERVLAAKVYGTLVLHEVTKPERQRGEPLDLFLLCSSTSAVTGPAGQVDYVAANVFLDAFAMANPDTVRSLAWGIWTEVGMAVDAARRLQHGQDSSGPAKGPFFAHRRQNAHGGVELTATLDTRADWVVAEHRTAAGDALLPGAAYAELARQALREIDIEGPFQLQDLVLLAPLPVPDDAPASVRTTLTPAADGYAFEVSVGRVLPGSNPEAQENTTATWMRTAQARLTVTAVPPAPVDLASALAASPRRGPLRTRQHDHLRFGPRWNVTRAVHLGDESVVARLQLPPEFVADLDTFVLHPAVVDLALCCGIEAVPGYDGDRLWVPVSADTIAIHHHDGQPDLTSVTAVASVTPGSSQAAGYATFDVTVLDAAQRVVLQVERFTMKRLDGTLDLTIRPTALDDLPHARNSSASEQLLLHNLEQGIRPDEGAAAFERVLTEFPAGAVVVSSLDLHQLRHQVDAASAASLRGAGAGSSLHFARPPLEAGYVAASNPIEETLVELWTDLLGVSHVGINDSFFDLGGHSLVAVRLFARIRKLFSVDLPISVLLNAPTVAACAALIHDLAPAGGQSGAAAPADGTDRPVPSRHLVPMHHREHGGGTPFFMVAGMFGNVLNLRHLAGQVSPDRPFYGLQARGLFDGDAPHETFEEMAVAYIAEIRQVQPHGPYLLGGFSGGGITALEIARQLLAAGEEIGLVAMLDTPAPALDDSLSVLDRVVMQWHNLRQDKLSYLTNWWRKRSEWKRAVKAHREGSDVGDDTLHNVVVERAFYRALDSYELQYYPGEVTLFRPLPKMGHELPRGRAIDENRNFVRADNGWRQQCDTLTLIEVPGDHDSMVLEPHVRVLADRLRSALTAGESTHDLTASTR